MSPQNTTRLIRAGILTLPIAGLLKLLGQFGTFNSVGLGIPDREAAQAVSSTSFFVGEFVGSVLPVVLTIFGVIALFAYLANTSAWRWATIAMISCILGLALILPALGVINYAFPPIGRAYLAGQQDVFGIVNDFFRFPLVAIFFLAFFYPIGAILFGIGIWRSGALPKWVGVLYAISGLFLSFPLPIHILRVAGGVMLVLGGGAIALSVLRHSSAQVKIEAQPRVR
ncbi:MAG: hypothetical protein M3Z24_13755 [Chloroflexota bacterium]|nr:hypothetical protein [Chloroflexota bacterium]